MNAARLPAAAATVLLPVHTYLWVLAGYRMWTTPVRRIIWILGPCRCRWTTANTDPCTNSRSPYVVPTLPPLIMVGKHRHRRCERGRTYGSLRYAVLLPALR